MNILTLSSLLLLRHADAKKNMTIDLTSSPTHFSHLLVPQI